MICKYQQPCEYCSIYLHTSSVADCLQEALAKIDFPYPLYVLSSSKRCDKETMYYLQSAGMIAFAHYLHSLNLDECLYVGNLDTKISDIVGLVHVQWEKVCMAAENAQQFDQVMYVSNSR